MHAVVVQVVVVTGVERFARTRRPAQQELRAGARVQRVVIDDGAREPGFGELIGPAPIPDVDVKGNKTGVSPDQPLFVEAQRSAKFVRRLIGNATVYLQQVTASRIQRYAKTERRTEIGLIESRRIALSRGG